MSDDTATYNAWTNEETQITYRWVIDDDADHEHWRVRAAELLGDNAGATEINQAIERLADELRYAVESECSIHFGNLGNDLLNSALERVVWQEIAKVILGEIVPAALAFDWLFPFGRIVETEGVTNRIPVEERLDAVARHAHGDWGEVDGVDWSENEAALRSGERIYSEYRSKAGETFLIITAPDRSVTTVLMPTEY